MKRIFAVILAMSLLLSLAACGKKSETVSVSPTPAAAPTETLTPTAAPEPTPTPTPVPVMPELPEVHDEALNALLNDVLTVYPGSAGCSLRAAGCAARLLDWGMETALTDDEIYSAVGSFLDTLGDEDLHIFLESILSVYDASYNLRGEYGEGLLSDAGVSDSLYPWNDRAFRAMEMISYGCGLR
ncbi:MAG: hypothetical protein IJV41_11530 [Oscillospiraceae bacterium]|nr:hypothetical protein [Oscillospiraceae bacterium]